MDRLLEEFDSEIEDLDKNIMKYKEVCSVMTEKTKSEEACRKARTYLNKISHNCNTIFLIYDRKCADKYRKSVDDKYGEGFVEMINHFSMQHHDGPCIKGTCEHTPGSVIFLDDIIKQIKNGHKLKHSPYSDSKNPESDIYG